MVDIEGNGTIDCDEIAALLKKLGFTPDEAKIREVVNKVVPRPRLLVSGYSFALTLVSLTGRHQQQRPARVRGVLRIPQAGEARLWSQPSRRAGENRI